MIQNNVLREESALLPENNNITVVLHQPGLVCNYAYSVLVSTKS